ncbi:glycoside hydrolase family 16 protein [Nocardioides sp. LHD-245]|uniref:glycoside hydrolase family 16 protein n=1 Tax=Nocardioides sp. LHD-245 TaxID=3051387 RepID=UPI0027E0A937|nr:glycoside hydrolase family 16 protein [Nocardioides sp. LHD-245]
MGFKRVLSLAGAVLLVLGLQVQAMPETRAAAPVAAAGAVAAAVTSGDACGPRVRRPNLIGFYKCTFVDQFDGTALDSRYWHVMDGPSGSLACNLDNPQTVSVGSGVLRLTARPSGGAAACPSRADGSRAPYATGAVNTFWKWSQQYGRFEARMKSDVARGPGAHEAFWLWPDVRYSSDAFWPASGEIDIVETYAAYPDLAIPFLHYSWNDNGGARHGLNTAWNCAATRGQWHTYALEWTAYKLIIKVDGKTCLINTDGAASFRKRFIMAFSQLVSDTGVNKITSSSVLPSTLEVDYVKVWQ